MKHDYRHLSTQFDMDAWLDATDELVPGSHSANDVSADRPFVHMVGPQGNYLLRKWPDGTPSEIVERYSGALAVMNTGAAEFLPAPILVPGSETSYSVAVKEHRYSAQTWLDGRSLGRFGGYRTPQGSAINIPLPQSAHANAVIAQVAGIVGDAHLASETLDRSELPMATIQELMERVRKYWADNRPILGDKAAAERDIRRWLRCGNRMVPAASDLVRNAQDEMRDTSVVLHHDLWPENVLIKGHEDDRVVTGIVGWRHMSVGSPVMDIAQMCVQMQGWSAALTESIIDSYTSHRPLRPEQRRLIPAVAGLMLVETVGTMLTWSYLDESMIGHDATPVLRSGMKTLLDSLERITHILAPDIERTQRGFGPQRGSGYPRRDTRPKTPREKRSR